MKKGIRTPGKTGIEARYFTLSEAGEYFNGRSAESMRKLASRGRLPVIKMGKSILMDRLDLDRAMSEMKVKIED